MQNTLQVIEEPTTHYLQLDTVPASPDHTGAESSSSGGGGAGGDQGSGGGGGGSPGTSGTSGYTHLQALQPAQTTQGEDHQDAASRSEQHYQDMEHGGLTALGGHGGYMEGVGGGSPQGNIGR